MPVFDDSALVDALGARAPAAYGRVGRVKLIGEAAQALLDGRVPGREAAHFVGGALLAWLRIGGNLERDFLKLVANGSHITPARIWKALQAPPPLKGQRDAPDAGRMQHD